MILAVRCDQPTFKTVSLQRGFNIILAERTQESLEKGSRNGLGKTTLIEIIHFCLGSAATKGKGLLREPLMGWTFSLDMMIRGRPYSVHRNTEEPSRIYVDGDYSYWPVRPEQYRDAPEPSLSVPEWRYALGWLMFDLPASQEDSQANRYRPTFRSLISYFMRRGRDAFSRPFEHHRSQKEWDKQVNNAFLLGLNWELASSWQVLKDREKALSDLAKAAKSGILTNLWGTIGELEANKVRIEEQLAREREQLGSFMVHPQYRRIEAEANAHTAVIHRLVNANYSDQKLKRFYTDSFYEERAASEDLIAQVYEEARLELPTLVVKRLEDVREFNRNVVANRREFLEAEILRLEHQLSEREGLIRQHTEERAKLLSILSNHGALEEYTRLQERFTETVSTLEETEARIDNLRKVERERSAVSIDKERLQQEARVDYEERRPIRERAISFFNANSEALYEAPGNLVIDIGPAGYKFQVEIERSTSQGFEQMKVFCYDLMLAKLWSAQEVKPSLLIHDSTIFDGVDERQVAHALQSAAQGSENFDFQYICCLNSDRIPWEDLDEDFDLERYVRLKLTDAREDGSLLGIRF